jgi:hypothetical protein
MIWTSSLLTASFVLAELAAAAGGAAAAFGGSGGFGPLAFLGMTRGALPAASDEGAEEEADVAGGSILLLGGRTRRFVRRYPTAGLRGSVGEQVVRHLVHKAGLGGGSVRGHVARRWNQTEGKQCV